MEGKTNVEHWIQVGVGILLPFLGTALGAAAVFLMKKALPEGTGKALSGFAAGVMLAASVWSLLIPAAEMAQAKGTPGWIAAVSGFFLGVGFLLILDGSVPYASRKSLLAFAVTLHNLPEGMAVGVVFAGALAESSGVTMAGAFALSLGIALQNLPEGAIVSAPAMAGGCGKGKAFLKGVASGVVEPLGALLAFALSAAVGTVLPYVLSFAAGAMIYVVVEELIPEAHLGEHSHTGTLSVMLGFLVMMILDVALG